MSDFPISCVLCRRKKIKCNKRKPCNQCVKKGSNCNFPSKFRNVSISDSDKSSPKGEWTRGLDNHESKLAEEVELLRKEKLAVLHENFKLSQKNHELRSKLQIFDRSNYANADTVDSGKAIEISGETTELGEKYYGPSLSNFMIEALRKKTADDNQSHKHTEKQSVKEEGTDDIAIKKPLPWLIGRSQDKAANLEAIKTLITHFFDVSSYRSFVSKSALMAFVDNHDSIPDNEWENDDDLLLLHMVLILLAERLTPKIYNNSPLCFEEVDTMHALHSRVRKLINKALVVGFNRLRHNLLNESVYTVQAYILCTEWYFVEQKYEEAWSMIFHCCSVAYAIGLHVVVTMRTTNESLDRAVGQIADLESGTSSDSENTDDDGDVQRFKVWFALKYTCGQLCSVLGRPNPILIQIDLLVLHNSDASSLAGIHIDSKTTQVQLKMGLSECIRLSNMMLIESFMMNFTMEDVMRLDARFLQESQTLTWFASSEYQDLVMMQVDADDEESSMSLKVTRRSALSDLIILHINRAKLLEPFISQFTEPAENSNLVRGMSESIILFLDYSLEFVRAFLEEAVPQFQDIDRSAQSRIRLGRVFRTKYPFVNLFLYQGVIVIFTLLNYKVKDFVLQESCEFLFQLKERLNGLILLPAEVAGDDIKNMRFWSTNIMYLINKDIQHITSIFNKREALSKNVEEPEDQQDFAHNLDLDNFLTNLKDPFWLSYPENLPYYLSSPSDDGVPMHDGFAKAFHANSMGVPYNQEQYQGMWNQQQHTNFDVLQQPLPHTSTEKSLLFASMKPLPYRPSSSIATSNLPTSYPTSNIDQIDKSQEYQQFIQQRFNQQYANRARPPMAQSYQDQYPNIEEAQSSEVRELKPASELGYAQSETMQRSLYSSQPEYQTTPGGLQNDYETGDLLHK